MDDTLQPPAQPHPEPEYSGIPPTHADPIDGPHLATEPAMLHHAEPAPAHPVEPVHHEPAFQSDALGPDPVDRSVPQQPEHSNVLSPSPQFERSNTSNNSNLFPRREPPAGRNIPEAVFQLEVEKIVPNPDQPRRNFDESALKELAASIREFGLLQPIVVSKVEHEVPEGTRVEYQLIAGERRLMAAKLLGLELVPAIIRNLTYSREGLELAVIENIQRENLNPIEMARAFARLQDEFRLTQREVASRLGKSREVVANTIRLLDLPQEIREALERGEISESHGRLLLTIDDQGLQRRLFQDLLENRMSTRELRHKVRASAPAPRTGRLHEHLPPELKHVQEELSSALGAPVKIDPGSGSGGKITISFYSEEELRGILERFGKKEE